MPPALEFIEPAPNYHHTHQNAVQNVMRELADAKEHIDRTVLPSSHTFGGRPCLNMKEFFKLMTEKDKKQQNLDALYSLVENDSDSIIGFVELNGLSFIDEWLDIARKGSNHWFALCILQFLAHHNLSITYEALQTAPIAKAVKQFVNPMHNRHSLSPQSVPRLTDSIRALLPEKLNVSRAHDNFVEVIDRSVLHKICHENHNVDAIRYVQSQFANRIVNKWKKFVGEWKKSNSVTKYRAIRFADEQLKPLATSTAFSALDAPMTITQERDKKRREKMVPSQKWYSPQRMHIDVIYDGDQKCVIERGRDSEQKRIQKERVSVELEEFSIGTEKLKDPKSLASNQYNKTKITPKVIPLESEQTSPSPEKSSMNGPPPTAMMYPHPQPHPPPAPMMYPYHGYAPPPPPYHPHPYHPNMPPPPYAPHHPGYPQPQPQPHPGYAPHFRKREFDVNRPAKRQKTHDRHYDDRRDSRRKRRNKRHKMRRGRGRG
eukprot:13308_1